MLRFILNFFIFGLLFYAIWYFFPDAFTTLTTWAGDAFDYIKSLVQNLSHKVPAPGPEKTGKALFDLLNLWF